MVTSATIGATINFVNTALGGALCLFGISFSVSRLGIFWFLFFSILTMILTHFSIQFLCRSAELSQSISTHNLAKSFFGDKGSTLTKIFVCFGNWTYIVNIIQIFADFVPQILSIWLDETSFFTSRYFAVIIGLLVIFPWVLVKDISKLEKLSVICLVFVLFIVIVLISNAAKCIHQNAIPDNFQIFVTSAYDIFLGIPTVAWCWGLQFNAVPIYLTLHPHTRFSDIRDVSLWSCFIIFLFYACQGIPVYIAWANSVNTDFITNLDSDNANYRFYFQTWLSTLTQLIIAISCFFAIPILCYECRTNLHSIIESIMVRFNMHKNYNTDTDVDVDMDDMSDSNHSNENTPLIGNRMYNNIKEKSLLVRVIEGSCICISAAFIALMVSDLNLCITLVGATYACYMSYFLPSGVFLRTLHGSNELPVYDKLLKYVAMFSILYGGM
eukprot:93413_1